MKPTVKFVKDLSSNYMSLSMEKKNEDSFALKMLVRNKIDGLLKMEVKMIDDKEYYYYDITSKQPLSEMIEKQQVSFSQLQKIYQKIFQIPDILKEFLLHENSIMMSPEFIYADTALSVIEFCYYPGIDRPLQEQVGEFTEYLMNRVDYRDEKAVLAVYAIYQVSHDKNCTLEKLKKVFEKQCAKTTREDKEEKLQEKKKVKNGVFTENLIDEFDNGTIHDDEIGTRKTEADYMEKRIKKISPDRIGNLGEKEERKTEFPFMEERVEDQKEVMKYPWKVYVLAGVLLVLGLIVLFFVLKTGILDVNGKPDIKRYVLAAACYLIVEGVGFLFIFRKDNLCAKVEDDISYIDWEEDYDMSVSEISGLAFDGAGTEENYYRDAFLKETGNCTYREKKNSDNNEDIGVETEEESDEAATELLVDFRDSSVAYLESEFSGERIYFKKFPFLIGKLKKGNDYVLENNNISRIHARFDYDEGRYYIEDMDSTNGTGLNNELLPAHERKVVSDGDRVCLADKNFIFHC